MRVLVRVRSIRGIAACFPGLPSGDRIDAGGAVQSCAIPSVSSITCRDTAKRGQLPDSADEANSRFPVAGGQPEWRG